MLRTVDDRRSVAVSVAFNYINISLDGAVAYPGWEILIYAAVIDRGLKASFTDKLFYMHDRILSNKLTENYNKAILQYDPFNCIIKV